MSWWAGSWSRRRRRWRPMKLFGCVCWLPDASSACGSISSNSPRTGPSCRNSRSCFCTLGFWSRTMTDSSWHSCCCHGRYLHRLTCLQLKLNCLYSWKKTNKNSLIRVFVNAQASRSSQNYEKLLLFFIATIWNKHKYFNSQRNACMHILECYCALYVSAIFNCAVGLFVWRSNCQN